MEVDKGVSKIKFCYPMFACEEIHKACEESDKSPVRKYLKASFFEKDFFGKRFFALLKIVY